MATQAVNTKVSVALTSTAVLAAGSDRSVVYLTNDSDTPIYISFSGAAVLGQGIRLAVNSEPLRIDDMNLVGKAMTAICLVGTKNLSVMYK